MAKGFPGGCVLPADLKAKVRQYTARRSYLPEALRAEADQYCISGKCRWWEVMINGTAPRHCPLPATLKAEIVYCRNCALPGLPKFRQRVEAFLKLCKYRDQAGFGGANQTH